MPGWSRHAASGCEQAAGRRHMGRYIVQNRIGYLLLRGERKGEKKRRETEKCQERERHVGVRQDGTERVSQRWLGRVSGNRHGLPLKGPKNNKI